MLPIIDDPQLVGVALGIVAGGIPLYYLFIYWKSKPIWMRKLIHSSDIAIQKLFDAEHNVWEEIHRALLSLSKLSTESD